MKIGLYFGSFNPIHIGHLIIANHVANFSTVEQVWLVISPQNPLKPSSQLLNEYHRLHLVQTAIAGNPLLKACDIEFKLPKPSYTIDTLIYLEQKYPAHEFCVLMGSDSFTNLPHWKNYKMLLANYEVIIYQRPNHIVLQENIPESAKKITLLTAPMLDISATTVRNHIREGKSTQYLLPDVVNQEIQNNGYYKG